MAFADMGKGLGSSMAGIADIAGVTGKGGYDKYRDIESLWAGLTTPNYDARNVEAPLLRGAGEMTPETYDAQIAGPVSLVDEDPRLRESQMGSLLGMETIAAEGLPLVDRLAAQDAQRSMASQYQRGQQGVLSDMARRGRLGGGSELSARMASAGDDAELARGMGADIATMSAERRLRAIKDSLGMSSQIRGADLQAGALNSSMQNRYNEYLSQLRTQASADAAGARERTQAYNVGNRQRIADTNVMSRYGANVENLDRRNRLASTGYQDMLAKLRGQSGAMGQSAWAMDAKKAGRRNALGGMIGGGGQAVGGFFDSYTSMGADNALKK